MGFLTFTEKNKVFDLRPIKIILRSPFFDFCWKSKKTPAFCMVLRGPRSEFQFFLCKSEKTHWFLMFLLRNMQLYSRFGENGGAAVIPPSALPPFAYAVIKTSSALRALSVIYHTFHAFKRSMSMICGGPGEAYAHLRRNKPAAPIAQEPSKSMKSLRFLSLLSSWELNSKCFWAFPASES